MGFDICKAHAHSTFKDVQELNQSLDECGDVFMGCIGLELCNMHYNPAFIKKARANPLQKASELLKSKMGKCLGGQYDLVANKWVFGHGNQLSKAFVDTCWSKFNLDMQQRVCMDKNHAGNWCDQDTQLGDKIFISFNKLGNANVPTESLNVCLSECQAAKSICDLSDHQPGSCGAGMDQCASFCASGGQAVASAGSAGAAASADSADKICIHDTLVRCVQGSDGPKTPAQCRQEAADAYQAFQKSHQGCVLNERKQQKYGFDVTMTDILYRVANDQLKQYSDHQNNVHAYQNFVDNVKKQFLKFSFCTHSEDITIDGPQGKKLNSSFGSGSLVCSECESVCNRGFDICKSNAKYSSVQEQNKALDECGNALINCVGSGFCKMDYNAKAGAYGADEFQSAALLLNANIGECLAAASAHGKQPSEAQVDDCWSSFIDAMTQGVCFTSDGHECDGQTQPKDKTFILFTKQSHNVCVEQCQAAKSTCDLWPHPPGSCGKGMDYCAGFCAPPSDL